MTSAWKETPGRDDRAEGQDVGPDENQLEMFETAPRASTETVLPPEADLVYGRTRLEGGRQHVEMMVAEVSTRDFLDAGEADSDELRRLEDSIRWLMNEGSMRHIPRAATLPPVRGLSPVESIEDDSLLLNPDILFPPRSSRRRGGGVRGAAKVLLVSAVAAPTAYFISSWMQFPGTAAPSDAASISASVTIPGSFEERIAAVAPAPKRPPPEAARIGDEVSGTPQSEPMVTRGLPPVETSRDVAVDAAPAEPKSIPQQTTGVSATPADPAPAPADRGEVAPSSPPPPVAAPRKPALSAEQIAVMVERGRVLFEAGDLAAARLFFRRAANAGDAAAAVAMGATYDPDVLAKRFIRGIEADAQEARMWYEKARELGSPEGPRRIEMLAHR
jgi:TPR repeat protein